MTRNKQRVSSTEEEVFYNSSEMRCRLEVKRKISINHNIIWTYKCQFLLSPGRARLVLGNKNPQRWTNTSRGMHYHRHASNVNNVDTRLSQFQKGVNFWAKRTPERLPALGGT